MPLYLYHAAGTFPYRLDPLTKVVSLLLLFQIAMTLQHPLYLAGLLAGLLVLMRGWRILGQVWRGIWFLMIGLLLFTCLIWTLFLWPASSGGGEGSLMPGTVFGAGMGIRLDLMLLGGVAFLITTRVEEFTGALSRLGLPYRAGFALTLAFRLVPLFLENAVTVTEAQTCRGWEIDRGGPLRRARRFVPLVVPVFISSLRSADHLAMALESKGFGGGGGGPRPPLWEGFRWRDGLWLAAVLGVDAVVLALRWKGYGLV